MQGGVDSINAARSASRSHQLFVIIKRSLDEGAGDLQRWRCDRSARRETTNPADDLVAQSLSPSRVRANHIAVENALQDSCLDIRRSLSQDCDEPLASRSFVFVRVNIKFQVHVEVMVLLIAEIPQITTLDTDVLVDQFVDLG
jgi:hypothetical protein